MKKQALNPAPENDQKIAKSIIDKPKPPSRLKVLNHFWLALVIGLSVTLVAFEWRISKEYVIVDTGIGLEVPEMPELIPITVRKAKKIELSEPIANKKRISKNFADFKVIDDDGYKAKLLDMLGSESNFDPNDIGDFSDEEPDEGDVDIAGNPFSVAMESESMLPLFCECAHLPTKVAREACNNEKIQVFLHKNLRYPRQEKDQGKQGTALVNYIVDENGKVTEVTIENNTEYGFKKEAKRVVESLPCMKPAKQYNRNVAVRYRIPIRFVLRN